MKILKSTMLALLACGFFSGTSMAIEPLQVTENMPEINQNFDSMWSNGAASLNLPDGWGVDRNLSAPRKLCPWDEASAQVMYEGGVSLASNAKNGTWNFRSSADENDRAIGGLSTTVSGGTRCWSLMTGINNASDLPLNSLDISYDIEKYRKGANAAGFDVQLYFSYDGNTWLSAGDDFKTHFDADNETIGAGIVPISTTPKSAKLMVDVPSQGNVYLAWNVSVATGSTPDKAQGLAIDNISVKANFNSGLEHYVYVENATGRNEITLYSPDNNFYGAMPGVSPEMTKVINGVNYKVWPVKGSGSYTVSICSGDNNFGSVIVSTAVDTYLCASPAGVATIADPMSYTGWVDPSRPPFVGSGIFLRGDVNGWAADSSWEFSDEGQGTYVLYDKVLSGAFKVADSSWSSSCNYGTNGTNIMVDEVYELVKGTDDNISCGSYVFTCKKIILNISGDNASILLVGNDSETDLQSVYMVGDFNGWNYMSTLGELKLDSADNLFKGRVSLKAGEKGISSWLIYQRLGRSGAWGALEESDQLSYEGNLKKGNTYTVATSPGTYDVTFSLTDGAYSLTKVKSEAVEMVLSPVSTVLVPSVPEAVKVLSLNNSLIYYNDQDKVFNDIASAMGKNASWTKHTLLGKSLATHWDEGDGLAGDGTPGAKMMVRSDAWSHIILQEQSALPRTSLETFRVNVGRWVEYIREYCPNPNAVIILPVNWAYAGDWDNFSAYNKTFLENYTDVASEYGVVVCPVAAAYDNAFTEEGTTEISTWFQDDRHPELKSTYMAACMEYGLIYGVSPETITYAPEAIEADAAKMRRYAAEALKNYKNVVDHHEASIDFSATVYDAFGLKVENADKVEYAVDGGGAISSDGLFKSNGTRGIYNVTAKTGAFTKMARIKVADAETVVIKYDAININSESPSYSQNFDQMGTDAEAKLPVAWRIDKQTVGPRVVGTYAMASETTTYSGGTSLPSNAKNGIWNFGADGSSDRALGGITTGVANGTRAVNIYTHLYNDGKKAFDRLDISYNVEKYRKGNNLAGFAVQLYYSFDGRNWNNAGTDFYTYFAPDNETIGYVQVPGETIVVEGTLPVNFGPGLDLFLAWNISVASGDAAQGAMALAIDNIAFEAQRPPVPQTAHRIYVDDQTSWNALGLYAWGDSELFGAWPGQAPIDEKEINGINFKVFGLDVENPGSYNLIFNNWNNNKQLPDYNVAGNRDYYFKLTDNEVTELNLDGVEDVSLSRESLPVVYNLQGFPVLRNANATDLKNLPTGIYIVGDKKVAIR